MQQQQPPLIYTGERVIPHHNNQPAQGNYNAHIAMYQEFLPAINNTHTVIDIACGCGYGTCLIAQKTNYVFGYDIDQQTINFAKQYYSHPNITYGLADITNIPLPNNFADIIISIETFEHVNNIKKVISEISRVLKPNGLWGFSTPNGDRYPNHAINKFHIQHYTPDMLHSLLYPYFNIHINKTSYEHDSSQVLHYPTFGNLSIFAIKM